MRKFFQPLKNNTKKFQNPQAGLQIFWPPLPLDPYCWIKNDQPPMNLKIVRQLSSIFILNLKFFIIV